MRERSCTTVVERIGPVVLGMLLVQAGTHKLNWVVEEVVENTIHLASQAYQNLYCSATERDWLHSWNMNLAVAELEEEVGA